MNRVGGLYVVFSQDVAHRSTYTVVADCDDGLLDAALAQIGKLAHVPQDRQTVHAPPVKASIVIKKPYGLVRLGLQEDIQDDPAVSAGTNNDDLHGRTSLVIHVATSTRTAAKPLDRASRPLSTSAGSLAALN